MIVRDFDEIAHVYVTAVWRKIEREVSRLNRTQHTVNYRAFATAVRAREKRELCAMDIGRLEALKTVEGYAAKKHEGELH
jgi:hypothetical protein